MYSHSLPASARDDCSCWRQQGAGNARVPFDLSGGVERGNITHYQRRLPVSINSRSTPQTRQLTSLTPGHVDSLRRRSLKRDLQAAARASFPGTRTRHRSDQRSQRLTNERSDSGLASGHLG